MLVEVKARRYDGKREGKRGMTWNTFEGIQKLENAMERLEDSIWLERMKDTFSLSDQMCRRP